MEISNLRDYLCKYTKPKLQQRLKWNQYSTDPTYYKVNPTSVKMWNDLIDIIKECNLNKLERSDVGSILKRPSNLYSYDILAGKVNIRLTVILNDEIFVISLGRDDDDSKVIAPSNAFRRFKKELLIDGINLDDYKLDKEKGAKIKEEIEKPLISMSHLDETLDNVHHIDFHNSYPGGLCNKHPEFKPTIKRIYDKRNDDKKSDWYKAILNYSIGCMQSKKHPWYAQWSYLSRDAIKDNNDRIIELATILQLTGREIIGYNTDGIWYRGKIYHGDGEGSDLGQWENDYTNCQFRAKSNGVYEFIGYDVKKAEKHYKAVVRGTTDYDLIEPDRDNWQWGDIYNGNILLYKYDEKDGKLYEKKI